MNLAKNDKYKIQVLQSHLDDCHKTMKQLIKCCQAWRANAKPRVELCARTYDAVTVAEMILYSGVKERL